MSIDLRHLRHFLLAAEHEHFGRAAEKARIAQPSLSRSVADLERIAGAALFDRVGRGVRLTVAGKALAEDAARALADIEAALVRAKRLAGGTHGTLRVGFVESSAWGGEVPAFLGALRARLPDLKLDLRPAGSVELRALLAQGRLDCAFAYAPEDESDEGLARLNVRTDSVLAALPKDHRLAARKTLRVKDLAGEAFVLFPRDAAPAYWDRLMAACAKGGLVPDVRQEAGNDGTMLSLVAAGIGVTLANSVARWRRPNGVALIDIVDLDLPLRLDLVWNSADRNPALAHAVALARGAFTRPAERPSPR
ncbi:MAG: LysR family transcriptional regulator [Tagaea sp.]